MKLQGKSVLVTGASGFIGSHLTERLVKEKANVSIIDRNENSINLSSVKDEIKIYNIDLRNSELVRNAIKEIKPDAIFHLSSFTSPERDISSEFILRNDLFSTINLFKALNGNFDLFVNTGTCEEYGNGPTPFLESQSPIAVSPYSTSKIATTHYCQMLHNVHKLPITILRPFLTYGPRQGNFKMLIPASILNALKNKNLKMTKGEQTRDFIYVKDVVEGYIKAARTKKAIGEIINIGSGKEYKIRDIVLKINKLLHGVKPEFGALPCRAGETMHFYCSNRKAKRLLNWKPKTTLDSGLKITTRWYKEKFESGELEKWMRRN